MLLGLLLWLLRLLVRVSGAPAAAAAVPAATPSSRSRQGTGKGAQSTCSAAACGALTCLCLARPSTRARCVRTGICANGALAASLARPRRTNTGCARKSLLWSFLTLHWTPWSTPRAALKLCSLPFEPTAAGTAWDAAQGGQTAAWATPTPGCRTMKRLRTSVRAQRRCSSSSVPNKSSSQTTTGRSEYGARCCLASLRSSGWWLTLRCSWAQSWPLCLSTRTSRLMRSCTLLAFWPAT